MNRGEFSKNENSEKPKLRKKLTQIMILKWNLKLYKDRLGWNTIPNPRLHSNWSNYSPESRLFIKIQKNVIVEFKRRFLPRRSSKSHSQTLCGCKNESITNCEQDIQEMWCLISLIKSNCSWILYIIEEHQMRRSAFNLGVTVWSDLIHDQRLSWNASDANFYD